MAVVVAGNREARHQEPVAVQLRYYLPCCYGEDYDVAEEDRVPPNYKFDTTKNMGVNYRNIRF